MSQSYDAVQGLLSQGFSHEEVAAFLTIMKNEKTQQFAIKSLGLMKLEDDDCLVDQLNHEFSSAGFSVADEDKNDEYMDELYGYEKDFEFDIPLGQKLVSYDVMSAFGAPSVNPYEQEWLDSIDYGEVVDGVEAISKVDSDWGVFVTPRAKVWSKRDYVRRVQVFADEKYVEEGKGDQVVFKGFEVSLPKMVSGQGVSYDEQKYDHGEDGYCFVEKLKHLNQARKNNFDKFFCEEKFSRVMKKHFKKCFVASNFYFFSDEDEKFEDDSDEESQQPCAEQATESTNEALVKIYGLLKAPPGRAYYLHEKNRVRTMEQLRRVGYLNQGAAKKTVKKQSQASPPPDVRDRDRSWLKDYAHHVKKKTMTDELVVAFGEKAYELSQRVGDSKKHTIPKRMMKMVEARAVRFDRFLYEFVEPFANEHGVSEQQAREAIFLMMAKSFGSYDVFKDEDTYMIRRHRK